MGVSFASRYNFASLLTMASLDQLRLVTAPLLVHGPVDNRTLADLLHEQYSIIRWFFDAPSGGGLTATGAQVPSGTQLGSTGVALEDL
jgi:hypothetical protein